MCRHTILYFSFVAISAFMVNVQFLIEHIVWLAYSIQNYSSLHNIHTCMVCQLLSQAQGGSEHVLRVQLRPLSIWWDMYSTNFKHICSVLHRYGCFDIMVMYVSYSILSVTSVSYLQPNYQINNCKTKLSRFHKQSQTQDRILQNHCFQFTTAF